MGLAAGKGVLICALTLGRSKSSFKRNASLDSEFGSLLKGGIEEVFDWNRSYRFLLSLPMVRNIKILPRLKIIKRIGEGDTESQHGGNGCSESSIFCRLEAL